MGTAAQGTICILFEQMLHAWHEAVRGEPPCKSEHPARAVHSARRNSGTHLRSHDRGLYRELTVFARVTCNTPGAARDGRRGAPGRGVFHSLLRIIALEVDMPLLILV